MSSIDQALRANDYYALTFSLRFLPHEPSNKLAVLACMDSRITVEQILGLKTGDAHIMRNAGGIVTEDAIRSLLVSHYLLGTQEFMIINHTQCGMMRFRDEEFKAHLEGVTGKRPASFGMFHTFTDLEQNVRAQIEKTRSHPWIPDDLTVRGFIYNVETGRLTEVR